MWGSAAASSASVLRTWVKFHRAWFPHTPAFPTWPAAVRAVAAQMKKKGYRSWANYLSRAKREHIQAGGVWDQVLDYTAKECTRSVTRGLGPPRQSAPLDIKAVAAVHLSVAPLCEGGPINPKALIILGSFFLTREIEISLALCRNVHILVGPVVCWVLPASKTDPAANTVTREWGCLCDTAGRHLCPAHVAVDHVRVLEAKFGPRDSWPAELPWFPTAQGTVVQKQRVVETIELVAQSCGDALVDELGRRRFGGHTLRVSGARHLAGMGLELYKLALLARWASPIIMRYVAEAPMAGITEDVRRLLQGLPEGHQFDRVWQEVERLRSATDLLQDRFARLAVQEEQSRKQIEDLHASLHQPGAQLPKVVQNLGSGAWHRILVDGVVHHPAQWRTWCGWRLVHARVARAETAPSDCAGGSLCEKCFKPVGC